MNAIDQSPAGGNSTQPLHSIQIETASMVMARAFFDDPFFTFTFPSKARRERLLPWIFERIIRYGQRYGKLITTASLEGIALWLGPEKPSLEWQGTVMTGLFLLPVKLKWKELDRSMRLSKFADKLHKETITGRHWYLAGLGVEPSIQNRGVGASLLRPVLELADRDKLACYLDTNNELNISFYEKVGFRLTTQGQARQDSPHTWGMLREPGKPTNAGSFPLPFPAP
jgi:ribosomal protein S18 acetylase RimI-like enzyme